MLGFKLKGVIQCMTEWVQRHLKSGGVKADGIAFGRNFARNPTDIVKLVALSSPSPSVQKDSFGELHNNSTLIPHTTVLSSHLSKSVRWLGEFHCSGVNKSVSCFIVQCLLVALSQLKSFSVDIPYSRSAGSTANTVESMTVFNKKDAVLRQF